MPKNLLEKALRETRNSRTSTRSLANNIAFTERDATLYGKCMSFDPGSELGGLGRIKTSKEIDEYILKYRDIVYATCLNVITEKLKKVDAYLKKGGKLPIRQKPEKNDYGARLQVYHGLCALAESLEKMAGGEISEDSRILYLNLRTIAGSDFYPEKERERMNKLLDKFEILSFEKKIGNFVTGLEKYPGVSPEKKSNMTIGLAEVSGHRRCYRRYSLRRG